MAVAVAEKSGVATPSKSEWASLGNSKRQFLWNKLTLGQKIIVFVEWRVPVPEGKLIGETISLLPFQRDFILAAYDERVRRAILSTSRKNGKTTLIASLILAHLVGPASIKNSRIYSGAVSAEQASVIYDLMMRMIVSSRFLAARTRIYTGEKKIMGLERGTEFRPLASKVATAHGRSSPCIIIDECGQIRGPHDEFFDALVTSQSAYDNPKAFFISTQAADDNDYFSILIDDALDSDDPSVVCHLHTAPKDMEIDDPEAWKLANPALGIFRDKDEIGDAARRAKRMPSEESAFRWLNLNQRVEHLDPFLTEGVFQSCDGMPREDEGVMWYGGLDLGHSRDLTAYVRVGKSAGEWHCHSRFWLPSEGLRERSKLDRQPYDRWAKEGFIELVPGPIVDYGPLADAILSDMRNGKLEKLAYDRWNIPRLMNELVIRGAEIYETERLVEFGQGFQSMTPALRVLEEMFLKGEIRHGGNPVLEMCFRNAVVQSDPAGNRKFTKISKSRRIDGAVAMAMASKTASEHEGVAGSIFDDPAMLAVLGID